MGGPMHMMGGDPADLKGASIDRAVIARSWAFAKPYRGAIYLYLSAIVVAAVLALVPPLLFRAIIDDAIPNKDAQQVTIIASLMVLAAVADAGLNLVQRWCTARVGEGLIFKLRVSLFDKVQQMPVAFYTHTQTGALVSRMNNDVIGAQSAVTGTLGSFVSDVVTLGTTLIALTLLEWRLTLVALVLFPMFVLPAKRVGKRMSVISRQRMDLNARMNSQMSERFNVSGAQLVKLFGSYDRELDQFETQAAKVRDTGITQAMYGRVFFIALGLLGAVGTAAVYGIGGHLAIEGVITTGTLVMLAAYLARVYAPMTGLTNARVDLMSALVSFERVFEVLDAPNPITDSPGAVDLASPQGRVQLDHVSFRYPPASAATLASLEAPGTTVPGARLDELVLRDIDLEIEPGSLVALVGPSGAGKTTIASLLPRLYDVTSGAVRIDGHDVRELTGASLHAAIGVVSQDPHLFHESVGDNLRYARPDATEAEVVEACRAARIHDVIAALPQGYATVVGERGYRMSGGEKQRLAIARMLLKDPAIVILDEATSHLDSENESLVQEALDVALAGRTSIVIAHRLSTIRNADLICVVEDGSIVERGTHDELLAAAGLYADLYRTLQREPTPTPAGL